MKKKIIVYFTLIILIIGVCSSVKAAELKTQLEEIKQASETKNLENNQGYITKKITNIDKDKGEVTIELQLSNIKPEGSQTSETINISGSSEIFLLIDESGSMSDKTDSGKRRREIVRESSKKLVKSILEKYKNVKIGIIKFADKVQLTSELTSDIDKLNTAIDTYTGGSTDLYDALIMAKENYSSSNVNKLAIILTDGSPNKASVSKDSNGKSLSTSEITKQELINLGQSGVNIITMMTEIENKETAEEIFGTTEKPTIGKYYYISDNSISNVIENNIYSDIIEKIHVANESITETKIVDYFPEDITSNFEFSYAEKPSIGTTSDTIDSESKTITWDIGTLKGDEVATLKYKLKIKDMKNSALLNKTIATNEKVVLTYKDKDTKDYTVILTSSPEIRLSEIKNDTESNNSIDNNNSTDDNKNGTNENNEQDLTIAKGKLPQTGVNMTVGISLIAVIAIAVIMYKKYNNYKGIK